MHGNTTSHAEKAETLRNAGFTPNHESHEYGDIFDEFENNRDIPVWERPTPFDDISLPPFPVNELPVIISDYVRAVAESTQTAPDMAATAALAVLSLCLQGKYTIEGKKDWREPLNLYTLIVALPAERKSAVMNHILIPVRQYEKDENERLAPLIEQNKMEKAILLNRKKALEAQAAKPKADFDMAQIRELSEEITEFEETKPFRLYYDDITPQKLAEALSDNNGRTAILSSEGGIFDILSGKYSNNTADIDVFLKAHAGDSIRVDRIGRASNHVESPAMTTLLFVQPNVIESLMSNGTFHGRGLCARFLYSIPTSRIGSREFESAPIPEINADRYNNLIMALLKLKGNGEALTLSAGAYEILKGFSEYIEGLLNEELYDIQAFGGKLAGAVLRIAGLLHIANNIDNLTLEVNEHDMGCAMNIGTYFIEHAKKAYQIMGADEVAGQCKYILKQLRKSRPETINVRNLMKLCKRFKTMEETTPPIIRLCEHGYLRELKTEYSGTGRPQATVWEINPATYEY